MRITHKVRAPRTPKQVEISEAYQAQVDRSTAKLEREYAKAQKRLKAATDRWQWTQDTQAKRQVIDAAQREYERRFYELRELERLMTASPAGAVHRGTEGWTKVPR